MTLGSRAARWSRPQCWGLAAAGLLVIAQLSGCSHHTLDDLSSRLHEPGVGHGAVHQLRGSSQLHRHDRGRHERPSSTVPSLSGPVDRLERDPEHLHQGGSGSRPELDRRAPAQRQIGPDPEYDQYSPSLEAQQRQADVAAGQPGAGPRPAPEDRAGEHPLDLERQ